MKKDFPRTSPGARGLVFEEPLLFEHGSPGRNGVSLPATDVPEYDPAGELGQVRGLIDGMPEQSEVEVFRHFVRLSQWNYGIDSGFYPLGSCTMKYNPKSSEYAARMLGFANAHPLLPDDAAQGVLELFYRLERALAEISGFAQVTLQPAAGAQGELCGMLMIRAWHEAQGRPRKTVLVPDTAHGTNPASSALCGYQVRAVKSGEDGILHPDTVAAAMDEDVAAIMITNPNTLGIFEKHIAEIARIVHAKGGLVYGDGANMNALLGRARPGEMGFDVMQFNLHKTFATPHGGGGPGAGPVAVTAALAPYLPTPVVVEENGRYRLDHDRPRSIGKLRTFWGNTGMIVRAYALIREYGAQGCRDTSGYAVLNANYLRAKLAPEWDLAYDTPSLHEVVFTDKRLKETGVTTMDVAKRLIDHGYHPPTVYFPLVVHGALMVEPTETESKETLDAFVAAMSSIVQEARSAPEALKKAPERTFRGRLDEARAARKPVLRWKRGMEK